MRYFKTFQTLHGRRVSAWLPSTSQWAPIESIQRPEQKRRKRLQVFVKKNPNSNNILHSILSYILILYLSLLIIAYYIALIVFKIKTSNFLYVFMYLLFTSQTHPLCLKSLLVSFSLLESLQKKRSRTAQQRTLTSSGVAMVLDVSDIWFYAFHVRWRHVDAHHVASRVKVTRKTEAFQAGIMPYDRKWWHGFPWSSLNPFRSFTQSRSIQLNPLCLAYDLEQIGICRLWGARGARPEIVTGSAFTIWMDFWIGVRWLWWTLWMW